MGNENSVTKNKKMIFLIDIFQCHPMQNYKKMQRQHFADVAESIRFDTLRGKIAVFGIPPVLIVLF